MFGTEKTALLKLQLMQGFMVSSDGEIINLGEEGSSRLLADIEQGEDGPTLD